MASTIRGGGITRRLRLEVRLLRTYLPSGGDRATLVILAGVVVLWLCAQYPTRSFMAAVAAVVAAALAGAGYALWRGARAALRRVRWVPRVVRRLWPRWVVGAIVAGVLLAVFWPWGLSRPVVWPAGYVTTASGYRPAKLETRWIAGALEYDVQIGGTAAPAWLGGTRLPARLIGDLEDYRSGCMLVLELGMGARVRTRTWQTAGDGVESWGSVPTGRLRYRWATLGHRWALVPDCR